MRRLSMAMWWGGGVVVVRAGESLVHGEGPQRKWSSKHDTNGGTGEYW